MEITRFNHCSFILNICVLIKIAWRGTLLRNESSFGHCRVRGTLLYGHTQMHSSALPIPLAKGIEQQGLRVSSGLQRPAVSGIWWWGKTSSTSWRTPLWRTRREWTEWTDNCGGYLLWFTALSQWREFCMRTVANSYKFHFALTSWVRWPSKIQQGADWPIYKFSWPTGAASFTSQHLGPGGRVPAW